MSDELNDVRTKVLIAEDDAIVALDLQGMVMRLGFDVVAIVENGQTAIAASRRFQPDVILLDMVLSGSLDGIEVAREIHKLLDIPIVFCVSSPDLSVLARAKDISYAGYLLKPINPDSLATTLDTVLYKYKLEKRVEQAEVKFRQLAEKCDILQFFFSRNAAFEWTWNPETGAVLKNDADSGFLPVDAALKAIDSAVRSRAENDALVAPDADGKIALLVEIPIAEGSTRAFALMGIPDAVSGHVSGMLVPLERNGL